MKKWFIYLLSFALIALFVFLFTGCNAKIDNLSDVRYGVFDAICEDYSTTFIYGNRENPYAPDGVANSMVEFGIISVTFSTAVSSDASVYFSLKINDNIVSGKLEKSPFTDEFLADIGQVVSDDDTLQLSLTIEDEQSDFITLKNKNNNWQIDYEKASEVGSTALTKEVKAITDAGNTYEMYVKIITEQKTNFGTYFWAISVISSDGTKHTVVFATNLEEILVKN